MQAHDLCERELRVAGAGRQIDQQIVQLAPRDVAHELCDDLHDDRTAPDRGRIALHDEAQ